MFRILWIPGECKAFKETFMKCLRVSSFDNSKCRLQSKAYLECRMEQWVFNVLFLMKCWVNEIICLLSFFPFILRRSQLMTKEPLEKLGFKDLSDPPPRQANEDCQHWHGTLPQCCIYPNLCVWNVGQKCANNFDWMSQDCIYNV